MTANRHSDLPPSNTAAERGILGAMLRDNFQISEVVRLLSVDDFYLDSHRRLYTGIVELDATGRRADLVTLSEWLTRKDWLVDAGGNAYIAELWDAIPSAAHCRHYADIIRDAAIHRRMIEAANTIHESASKPIQTAAENLDAAERLILEIAERQVAGDSVPISQVISEAYERLDARKNNQGDVGIKTGFVKLDGVLAGFRASELILLAARPSVGKTALGLAIATHAALKQGKSVLFVSLEQGSGELAERLLSSHSSVDSHKLRKGYTSQEETERLLAAGDLLSSTKFFFDDNASQNMLRISANARRMHRRHGIQFIVIDYLQLIDPENSRVSRNEQVSLISRRLKFLARELQIPVLALSQLNRSMDEGAGREPKLSDLRDSGCIAKDSIVRGLRLNSRIDEMNIDTEPKGVYSVGMENITEQDIATAAWRTGKKTVTEMVLSTGHRIKATANHKFLCPDQQWKRLDSLNVGDPIGIAMNCPLEGSETVTLAEARLLGLLVANGCTLPRRSYQLTLNAEDSDIAKIAIADAHEIFPGQLRPHFSVQEYRKKHHAIQVFFPSIVTPSPGKPSRMTKWLQAHGLYGKRAKEKEVPPEIFGQSEECVIEFLRALFAGDGTSCITTSNSNENKHQYNVAGYSSSSRKLIDQVQWLLQCLGIVSGISQANCRGFSNHTLSVYSRQNKIRFAEKVGFIGKRKQKTMTDIVKKMMAAPLGWEKYIVQGDVAFVPIKSLAKCGTEDVWDMEVAKNHCFVANGIVAHNSLEQDADTVILMHRPDRSKDNKEIHSTAIEVGVLVEAIVAKQRNGPTGIAKLLFERPYMKFQNYQE